MMSFVQKNGRIGRFTGVALATMLIIVALYPWRGGFVDHPHWDRVAWIPFVSGPVTFRDILRNAFLFAPFGIAIAAASRSHAVRNTFVGALMISLVGEFSQSYSHSRFPSSTDFVVNVGAATLMAWVFLRLRRAGVGEAAETATGRTQPHVARQLPPARRHEGASRP